MAFDEAEKVTVSLSDSKPSTKIVPLGYNKLLLEMSSEVEVTDAEGEAVFIVRSLNDTNETKTTRVAFSSENYESYTIEVVCKGNKDGKNDKDDVPKVPKTMEDHSDLQSTHP